MAPGTVMVISAARTPPLINGVDRLQGIFRAVGAHDGHDADFGDAGQNLFLRHLPLTYHAAAATAGPAPGSKFVRTPAAALPYSSGGGSPCISGTTCGTARACCATRSAFFLTSVLTLALGIGATTAIFSVCDALLWKPVPLPDLDTPGMVVGVNPSEPDDWNSVGRRIWRTSAR